MVAKGLGPPPEWVLNPLLVCKIISPICHQKTIQISCNNAHIISPASRTRSVYIVEPLASGDCPSWTSCMLMKPAKYFIIKCNLTSPDSLKLHAGVEKLYASRKKHVR